MIRHEMSFYYLNTFVFTQVSKYFSDVCPYLIVDNFAPILGGEHDMVLAHPFRVRQATCLLRQIKSPSSNCDDLNNHHFRRKVILYKLLSRTRIAGGVYLGL